MCDDIKFRKCKSINNGDSRKYFDSKRSKTSILTIVCIKLNKSTELAQLGAQNSINYPLFSHIDIEYFFQKFCNEKVSKVVFDRR